MATLTLVTKPVKFADNTIGQSNFLTDGTNYWAATALVDETGAVITSASPVQVVEIVGGSVVSTTNPMPVLLQTLNGAALDATLTGGTQKTITRGGAKGTTTAADVTSTASGANHQPVDVAIYDASGNQITSFGGAITSASIGLTSNRVNSTASTNATILKASAGNIGNIDVFNVAAYDVYLKFYNKASALTVGTDTPIWTIPIKSATGYSRGFPFGKFFSTGIAYAITKLQADTDTTVLAAGDVTGSIDWI